MTTVVVRIDRREIRREVEPRNREFVVNVPPSRELVEAVLRDEQKPVDVDCRVVTVRATTDVLVTLSSVLEG
ncbi:hypothetical protein [Salinigranum halophilum]|uniref:hypothetical protein n=1 Tax=Salinigranum halophilum TaxID=2565931 RepID=UPI00115D9B29|nr:hypothetical protein [Salinigranum halophilum]